jgi:hypothetical protein
MRQRQEKRLRDPYLSKFSKGHVLLANNVQDNLLLCRLRHGQHDCVLAVLAATKPESKLAGTVIDYFHDDVAEISLGGNLDVLCGFADRDACWPVRPIFVQNHPSFSRAQIPPNQEIRSQNGYEMLIHSNDLNQESWTKNLTIIQNLMNLGMFCPVSRSKSKDA